MCHTHSGSWWLGARSAGRPGATELDISLGSRRRANGADGRVNIESTSVTWSRARACDQQCRLWLRVVLQIAAKPQMNNKINRDVFLSKQPLCPSMNGKTNRDHNKPLWEPLNQPGNKLHFKRKTLKETLKLNFHTT